MDLIVRNIECTKDQSVMEVRSYFPRSILRIIILLMLYFSMHSSMAFASEAKLYQIYYIPLEVNFYDPPTREDILQSSVNFRLDSLLLEHLFDSVNNQEGIGLNREDQWYMRILIIEVESGQELFITNAKEVLSLERNKKYRIKRDDIEQVLKELLGHIKKHNLMTERELKNLKGRE